MGNSESVPPNGNDIDDFDGIETLGYRVLGVQPNSPASAAGLVSFFDFLIGADGQMLLGSGEELQEGEEYDDVDFPALLEKFKGKTLQLLVWNIKSQEQRLVDIVPNDEWEGAGLLGVTIRLDNYAGAEDRLIRILTVEHNSPAAIAGLVPSQDYLLGTTTHSFDSTKVLAAVLEAHVDRVVELYVYNTNSDKVRVVALMPTWSWGGNGLLGAEVGTGYLHRLPGSCRGTLGGSVERRVRWIGGNKSGPATRQSQLQQAPALELEPQLEMEPNHEEEEEEQSVDTVSLASQVTDSHHATGPEPQPPAENNGNAENPQSQSNENGEKHSGVEPSRNGTEEEAQSVAPEPSKEEAKKITTWDPSKLEAPPKSPPVSGGTPGKGLPNPVAAARAVSAPAPYVIPASVANMFPGTDPAAEPVTITTFLPAAKPPDHGQQISAQDLFSGPPPVAKIPSKTNIVLPASPVATSPTANDQHQKQAEVTTPANAKATMDGQEQGNGSANHEPPFSTPHPPTRLDYEKDATAPDQAPQEMPPNQSGETTVSYGSVGMDDALPPPPKMSGAR